MSATCADDGPLGTRDLDGVPRAGILSIISAAAAILLAVQVGAQAFKLGANGGIGAAVRLAPWLTPFRSSSHVQVVIQTHPTNAWTLNHTNMALAFFSSVRRHWRRTVRTRWPRRAC